MYSAQTEVSQELERFKAYNSCKELKVLPTKVTSLPPLFESSPNAAQKLTFATKVEAVAVEEEGSQHPEEKSNEASVMVTEKTLSQEIAKYLRLYHDLRSLRFEQIDMDMEDPKEKEQEKKHVEDVQSSVVKSAMEIMKDAKQGEPLEELFGTVKKGIKEVERLISCLKDEMETSA
ncbi:hypothetical protein CARUB_v10021032mg [Capsella rubella]|uniref:Uncharacterized protein n=1 Tax=Capsella rubella TaxID=81985 RepID=R0GJ78_9BRAS|nr:uncharacterized protein LOC17896529 isoform X2 [Capsella rubella]EOA35801.1 hypothetical protein CARUB_v10021032mg [Capsella rubella]